MNLNPISPRKALNKAFLKVKPNRNEIEHFKKNLILLLDQINEAESEEFHKNLISDFLKNTYYSPGHFINTKSRNDLVIHNGKDAKTTVGVIIEAKKPTNKAEMISKDNINQKAMQELVLYYLRERISNNNLELKYLIATNIYEWFVFDAHFFEKQFAQNKTLVKQFADFEEGRMAGNSTDFFYKQIAAPAIAAVDAEFSFTYFDIRDYDKPLRNQEKEDDKALIPPYKIFAPQHLLKLPFANDSNSLDKVFYSELLHIIGLTEVKEGSKKLIERRKEGDRHSASLIENAILQLDSLDKISRIEKPLRFGQTMPERLFNIALELSITWINRILFLKLLEAQLVRYHKGDKIFTFLNIEKIKNFDDLNLLFFSVLARMTDDRPDSVKTLFKMVPYLNSSLFEPTELEHSCLFISQLKDGTLPVLNSTVLKDNTGKKRSGQMETLEYLFEFLNAYDFSSEGAEDVQEENKTLINASVLGLIFEKINGYKDGSFFTPGFITMYMCRETIRRAVVQKFNDAKQWNCAEFSELYDKIEDKKQANSIINSLKICDPAVGSGHFLVSALNEIIAIKSELKILLDRQGKTLRDYHVEVINDELIVSDEDARPFEYRPGSPESQRVQEALFHEKQTIIENCLFGVDINPNSVKICRLRLWIELLKNAYYKAGPGGQQLETLPNIDINIKCGNSLISRYALDADIKTALKRSKWTIDSYRIAVQTYRNAQSKDEKRAMERLITQIKNDFESEIAVNDKRLLKLNKLKGDLITLTTQTSLFEQTAKEKAAWNKQVSKVTKEVQTLEQEIEEIKSNKIYDNAFEWRFEFPEVLNDEGAFVGFNVVIGNPPYGVELSKSEDSFIRGEYLVSNYQIDTYTVFTELGLRICFSHGSLTFIIPSAWYSSIYDSNYRAFLFTNKYLKSLTVCPKMTFEDTVVETSIIQCSKHEHNSIIKVLNLNGDILNLMKSELIGSHNGYKFNVQTSDSELAFLNRIRTHSNRLGDFFDVVWGVKPYKKGMGHPPQTGSESTNKIFHSETKKDKNFLPLIGGSEVFPFLVSWKGGFINYGDWLAEPRNSDWFRPTPRIVVREITAKGRIYASYIDQEFVFSNSVDGIRSKTNNTAELKVLTGILNSKFASFFHLKTSSNSQKDTFPKVLIQNLRDFPYPSNLSIAGEIIRTVDEIILIRTASPNDDFVGIVSRIDDLVYQLYGLTEEEINLIEGSLKS